MGIFKRLLPFFLCLLLMGCKGPKTTPENRFVTGVHVQLKQEAETLERSYTDPQKMEVVLYYLRALRLREPTTIDPERLLGREFRIDLTYSDGSTRQIFQRADRYLSEDLKPWQAVEQSKAAFLYPLLQSMPSD